jgi:hypothetical protein
MIPQIAYRLLEQWPDKVNEYKVYDVPRGDFATRQEAEAAMERCQPTHEDGTLCIVRLKPERKSPTKRRGKRYPRMREPRRRSSRR